MQPIGPSTDGSRIVLPFNAAKAYGMRTANVVPYRNAASTNIDGRIAALPADRFTPSTAAQQLVAGTVTRSVDFDASTPVQQAGRVPSQVLQMYTRAADRMEAAVAVQLGRAVDVKG